MKTLVLTVEQLTDIVEHNQIIGQGGYGILYKLNEDVLFKFNYKDFINCFELKENVYNFRKINNIDKEISIRKKVSDFMNRSESPRVEIVKKIISRQKNVKLTHLTQGLVLVNDFCVGYLIKYHKNMVNFFEYGKDNYIDEITMKIIKKSAKEKLTELMENYIYLYDFSVSNILYDPENNNNIELIDFEDSAYCEDSRDISKEKHIFKMHDNFMRFIKMYEENSEELNTNKNNSQCNKKR